MIVHVKFLLRLTHGMFAQTCQLGNKLISYLQVKHLLFVHTTPPDTPNELWRGVKQGQVLL
jgi:hypothetical protein